MVAQNTCLDAFQYCGNTVTLPLDTSGADMGTIDCLNSSPNPTWFFFEVTQNGDINTQITGYDQALTSGLDIDVVVSGPYDSLDCEVIMDSVLNGNHFPFCDYSGSGVINYTLPNVQVGEVYIIIVTNYSNQSGFAEFFDTGSTATFDQSNCITQVDEVEIGKMRFNNPVFDLLSISGLPEEEYVFSIYDLTGKIVYNGNHRSENLSINTVELNSGYYITDVITSGGKKMCGKFIKASK